MSFATSAFYDLARRHGAAIVYASGNGVPVIDEATSEFTYARLMSSSEDLAEGVSDQDRRQLAKQARSWAKSGNVFMYFIAGAKIRNPVAARSLIREVGTVHR